jgi:hypothetical protein
MEILPMLLVIICAEGNSCRQQEHPMPSWEICDTAVKGSRQSKAPLEVDHQEFMISYVCIGQEKKD